MSDEITPLPPSSPRPPRSSTSYISTERRHLLIAIGMGALYGILYRLLAGFDALESVGNVMSYTFLFVMPTAMGFIVVYMSYTEKDNVLQWITRPWLAVTLLVCAALALAIEGLICIIVILPLAIVLSSVGGVIAGVVRRLRARSTIVLATVMFIPFIISPIEQQFDAPEEIRVVETSIDIVSTPRTIWENIRVVKPISPQELGSSFTHAIGFPRPIEATIDGEGVGAVRHATFEGDVLFIETVTVWVPDQRLEFSIKADPSIPPTTFDEHVVVGGKYFDVLDGAYRIEPLSAGKCRLHLTSRQRVTTRFNFYSGIWTEWFMRDIQTSILAVIKARCEKQHG